MVQFPAFCDSCGAAFRSGIAIENSLNVEFRDVGAGPCPNCGGAGHVPDGIFNFLGNVIEVLQAPQRTRDELSRLAKILDHARKAKEPAETTARRIEQELPVFKRVAEEVRRAPATFAIAFISMILTAIPLMLESEPKVDQRVVIERVINNYVSVLPTIPAAPKKPFRATPRLGPNEQCTCGSGKKYKRCCGSRQNPPPSPTQP